MKRREMITQTGQLKPLTALPLHRNSLSALQGQPWRSCSRRIPVSSAYHQIDDRATDSSSSGRSPGWCRLVQHGLRKRLLPVVRKVFSKGTRIQQDFGLVDDISFAVANAVIAVSARSFDGTLLTR